MAKETVLANQNTFTVLGLEHERWTERVIGARVRMFVNGEFVDESFSLTERQVKQVTRFPELIDEVLEDAVHKVMAKLKGGG